MIQISIIIILLSYVVIRPPEDMKPYTPHHLYGMLIAGFGFGLLIASLS